MKLLKEILDKPLPEDRTGIRIREAARAVLTDSEGRVPLLFVSKHGYHKLPGGGLDPDESKIDALKRECLEEVGCEIEVGDEIGMIVEYRSEFNMHQTSYCYKGKILKKGEPNFSESELARGFQIVWLTLDDAIQKLETDQTEEYEAQFILERDLLFLRAARD